MNKRELKNKQSIQLVANAYLAIR